MNWKKFVKEEPKRTRLKLLDQNIANRMARMEQIRKDIERISHSHEKDKNS